MKKRKGKCSLDLVGILDLDLPVDFSSLEKFGEDLKFGLFVA